jgi:Ser/Thr protein kinase RdoA (MazF antagonist)
MAWLVALRTDTDLGVPEPVAALDGSMVVTQSVPGVSEPRMCVLLRWQQGRFVDDRLNPDHLRAVGVLLAGLHEHALQWMPPDTFVRPRVDTLTAEEKRHSILGPAEWATQRGHAAVADDVRSCALIERLFSARDAELVARGWRVVRAASRELSDQPGTTGLIHADLHYENFLFRAGAALAIDFDDCGWGPLLYDLAVPLSELEGRPRYDALRGALLDGYSRHRPLTGGYEDHLRAFAILRRMQLLLWVIESREQAAFRDDWQSWGRKELDGLAGALDA